MSARNSVVSSPGITRCRPAHASGTPSRPRMTTPRSGAAAPPTASASRVKSSAAGRSAAVAPRSARRRASVTASASVAAKARDARVIRASRWAGQQHSMRRTWSTPATRMPPSTSAANTASPDPTARRTRTRASAAAATSAAPPATHARDPRLLVPVGTCEQHGPHLPLGCDTVIVKRLADDLSARFNILRAPTVEYGVNTATKVPYPGNAAVRRKTLHRWLNDLVGAWEQSGVETFVILTAHGHDPHQEALSTLRTRRARVFTVDVFALDFGAQLDDADGPVHGGELDTSLLLYLAQALRRMDRAPDFL